MDNRQIKTDCFGFDPETFTCQVLTFRCCMGCRFYKHIDDPSIKWDEVNKERMMDKVNERNRKSYAKRNKQDKEEVESK